MNNTVLDRQTKEKKLLIDQLKKIPIIQVACEKVGVGRATFYRWKKEDDIFSREADEALQEGKLLVNDMAESQLMSAIRNGNLTGIIFWLKNNHTSYKTKVEVTGQLKYDEKLTPEQEELINKALKLASVIKETKQEESM